MQPKNLLQILKDDAAGHGDEPCWKYKKGGQWQTLRWKEVYQKIMVLAGGLVEIGVKRGDRVCILSQTRYGWSLADLAIISCGAITVPVYQSSLPDQVAYILENAEVKVAFVENKSQLKKVQAAQQKLSDLKQVILFDDKGIKKEGEGLYTLEDLMLMGRDKGEKVFNEMKEALTLQTEATFVYTSGTTGPPKGAILTHGNLLSELLAFKPLFAGKEGNVSLMFLPLAHIFARVMQFGQLYYRYVNYYAESIDKLMDNILEVKPQIFASVPRIFEKVHTRVMQGVQASSKIKQKIFNWAITVGTKRYQCLVHHQPIPLFLKFKWQWAYRLVFSKLHQKMGGKIDFFISGGAPLSLEIADFFHAAGFRVFEGYGLTETAAAITCNTPQCFKPGTVGKPLPGVEIKIAEDGEILARGKMVFKGYHHRDEETREVIDEEGWFHTGDIGEFDSEGFLKITDRKKDLIVTAAGKNIAPQNIENLFKTDPLISQVVIHGDKRKYLTALITLDRDEIISYAKNNRIPNEDYSALVKNEKIHNLIKRRIEEKNKHLARYETIKKFAILDEDFSVETGELTPTLKVKRKFTSQKYREILDGLYRD